MKFSDILKKYWFILLISLGLLVYVVVYAINTYQNRPIYVSNKVENDKSVVYSFNGENYYADDFYNDIKENYVITAAFNKWRKEVVNAAIKTDENITNQALNAAAYIQQNNDETTINNALIQSGYPGGVNDLNEYALDMMKDSALLNEFFKNNYDTYAPSVIEQKKPKKISHILIKVENVEQITDEAGNTVYEAHMSEEEQANFDALKAALANNEDWNTLCSTYSGDTSNAPNGGYLGIYDADTCSSQFVKEFADAANAQDYGTISDEVLSQYGYHFIKIDKPSDDEIKNDATFMNIISQSYSFASIKAYKEKADEFGITIKDADLQARIDDYLNSAQEEIDNLKPEEEVETESEEQE